MNGIVAKIGARFMPPAIAALAVGLILPLGLLGYRDGPPPDKSGGFGDETCHMCHNDNALNDSVGSLVLEGVPEVFEAGAVYPITVRVMREGLRVAGFQMSARDGSGKQAGSWKTLNSAAQVVVSKQTEGLFFIEQTLAGSSFDGEAEWRMEWTAPEAGEAVTFFGAANAANDDASALGDHIYTTEVITGRSF